MITSIRDVITDSWPNRFVPDDLRADVSLGEGGLGLDSVELVEVILACEERSGQPATEDLFALAPLTMERMADYFLS